MRRLLLIVLIWGMTSSRQLSADPLWEQLVPRKRVPADAEADYSLTEQVGPWLVLAASFNGPEGEEQARELVLELRRDFHLPAYYYGMTFEQEDANPGRGIDANGARIRRRYNRGDKVVQHAVLAGEFPAIDDPDAQKLLKKIKTLQPESLVAKEGEETAQSLATVRKFQGYLRKQIGQKAEKGPMGHAFMTRNPLLPRDYFVPQGVDDDVAKWNEGPEYSLMKCPGKYSIRVATFRGRTSLKSRTDEVEDTRTRKAKEDDPLVVAVRNAHLLTVALREKGWDAYEFHDRRQSYVAVGSFDKAERQPNGQIVIANRDARVIFDTFGAMTPGNIFERPTQQDYEREELQKQRFNSLFANQHGKVAEGFHPKRFVGIPFDIIPEAVLVPRRSISLAYIRD